MKPGASPFWNCLRGFVCVAALGWSSLVWALDPDIAFQVRARKAEVTPLCPVLIAQTSPLSPQQTYHKALCLLYGLSAPVNLELALDLMRQVAPAVADAPLALADTLQQGGSSQQQEALQWYSRAAAAGDVRASSRHARLFQRMQADKAAQAPAPSDDANPFADPFSADDVARQPGYHCHFYGLGKKVCHASTMD